MSDNFLMPGYWAAMRFLLQASDFIMIYGRKATIVPAELKIVLL